MIWQQRSNDALPAAPIMLPDPIWQIVYGRGYDSTEKIEKLVQPKLKDLAHPFSLHHMDLAVARLIQALQNEEKILIYGDYDLDGSPGIVLLREGLIKLGFSNVEVFQPLRLKDGYGLHSHKIADFKNLGVQLIVTVDVGITDIESVDVANEMGIDVIITDHHLPKEKHPNAFAIVNPNKGNCESNLQHLCGTGVAFYLILALRMEMSNKKLLQNEFNPKELLDLFAIATITDMVPLIKENRVLVKHGLLQLQDTKRPGLKKLLNELGFSNKKLNASDVGFRIAPKLNALTRLEDGLRVLDVLMTNEESASEIIDKVLNINEKRVQLQKKALKVASELVESLDVSKFIWIHSKDFHPGVISLVASDLMNTYKIPVFVGSQINEKIICSARSPSVDSNLQTALQSAEQALHKFGGHKQAAGFELQAENSQKFQELLFEYFEKDKSQSENDDTSNLTDDKSLLNLVFDTIVSVSDLNESFMSWYENLGPFGMGFEVPLLLLKKVKVKKIQVLKGKYLKYTLEQGARTLEAVWFSGAVEFAEGSQVDVLFSPSWNEYRGSRKIQAVITAMREH